MVQPPQHCQLVGHSAASAGHDRKVRSAVARLATLVAGMMPGVKRQTDVTTPETAAHLCNLQPGRHSLQTGDSCLEQALQVVHGVGLG